MTDSTMTEIPLVEEMIIGLYQVRYILRSVANGDDQSAIAPKAAAIVETAAAMLKAAVEALEPFALKANYADYLALSPDDYVECAPFKARDYIRARDTLASLKQPGKTKAPANPLGVG